MRDILIRWWRAGKPEALPVTVTELPVPGLVMHRDPEPGSGWVLTHARSGCAVARFPLAVDPEAVLAAAFELGALTDWTQPGADIADEVTGGEVLDVAERWGGGFTGLVDRADRDDLNVVAGG